MGTYIAPYTLFEYHNPATFHGAIIAKQIYIHSASKISGYPFEAFDFGDAPDTGASTGAGNYNTLLSDNGPRHVMVAGLTLGTVIDGETDGQPIAGATGDDTHGAPVDEDAVGAPSFTNGSSPSVSVAVKNNYQTGNPLAGQQAFMRCWMDLNGNGSFLDAGEASAKIAIPASSGTANYSVSFGALSTTGTTYMRCRVSLTTTEVDNPTGAATSGEVEDHAVTITQANAAVGNFVWLDSNANGIQDSGETTGVAGVTVTLRDSAGNVVGSPFVTTASGLYSFTGLTPGSYKVCFTNAPAGYSFSPTGQGTVATDSDAGVTAGGCSATFTLTSGETNNTLDAGLWSQPTAVALRTLQAAPQSPWEAVLELLRLLARPTAR